MLFRVSDILLIFSMHRSMIKIDKSQYSRSFIGHCILKSLKKSVKNLVAPPCTYAFLTFGILFSSFISDSTSFSFLIFLNISLRDIFQKTYINYLNFTLFS